LSGRAIPSKKISLHRLVELTQPNIIILEETLGDVDTISQVLEGLLGVWMFIGLDARGSSRGLAIGWRTRSDKLLSSWDVESWLGVVVSMEDLGRIFLILNVYGPSQ
jgi:hypothetical protein